MTTLAERPTEALPKVSSTPPPPLGTERVPLHQVTAEGLGSLIFSLLAAVALSWVLYSRVLPFHGKLGFWLLTYAVFLGFYAAVSALQFGAQVVADRVSTVIATTGGVIVIGVLADLILYTFFKGSTALHYANFFTQSMALASPAGPLSQGGVLHAVIGSLEQLGLATAMSVPLGFLAALYMAEVGGRLAYVVRILVDAMTALPSIVAGLFVLSLYIVTLHLPQSGFAAALAIGVMMLPIITRAAEVIIRLVPNSLREAGYALGSSQWRVVWNVVLPTARSGLTTAIVLGMARGIGETSPVLLTAGFTKEFNVNPFSGQQVSLPLYIYTYIHVPQHTYIDRAFGAGVVLLAVVFVLFVTARILGGAAPGQTTRRQRRKLARASRESAAATQRTGMQPATRTALLPTEPTEGIS